MTALKRDESAAVILERAMAAGARTDGRDAMAAEQQPAPAAPPAIFLSFTARTLGFRLSAMSRACVLGFRRVLVRSVFFIFIFFKNIFYKNIFSISQFTVLYPYRRVVRRCF